MPLIRKDYDHSPTTFTDLTNCAEWLTEFLVTHINLIKPNQQL